MNDEPDSEPLLQELTCNNLLSFGPDSKPLSLRPLNVLIGPNGSGKSNLLEAVSLLRSTPKDVRSVILKGGGTQEWIFKGNPHSPASVEAILTNPNGQQPLRHNFSFRVVNQSFVVADERVENKEANAGHTDLFSYYHFQSGNPVINKRGFGKRQLSHDAIDPSLSILAQRRDPDTYPELTHISESYDRIRLYREWAFGRDTVLRQPQKIDLPNDFLMEDFSNLNIFFHQLCENREVKKAIAKVLCNLYDGLDDFGFSIKGGTIQIFFNEGDFVIPATRLSDGTLRYLCLLAILCDPNPPPLIGIEEPELGLHPDLLPTLADLLIEASERCQLIVTTHSDILVNAMTEHPESVVVCEKHDGKTVMQRLKAGEVEPFLKKFRLGDLWTSGQIGGNRW